jgi:hypothetical protein
LGNLAEVKAIGVSQDLKLDKVNRLVRRNAVDADDSRTICHG